MPDIVIKIRGEGDNLEVLDEAGRSLDALGQRAERSSVAFARFVTGYGASAGTSGQLKESADAATKIYNTLQQAFNINPVSRIGSEVEQGLDQDIAKQRQSEVKRYGANSQQVTTFDAQSQAALDQYLIATGQATQASLAFDAMLKQVHQSAADGQISIATEAQQLELLAAAATKGVTSMGQLKNLQTVLDMSPTQKGLAEEFAPQWLASVTGTQAGGGSNAISAMFNQAADGANTLKKNTMDANSSLTALGPVGKQSGSDVAGGMSAAADATAAANAQAVAYLGTLRDIKSLMSA